MKKIFLIVFTILLAISIAACSSASQDEPTTAPVENSEAIAEAEAEKQAAEDAVAQAEAEKKAAEEAAVKAEAEKKAAEEELAKATEEKAAAEKALAEAKTVEEKAAAEKALADASAAEQAAAEASAKATAEAKAKAAAEAAAKAAAAKAAAAKAAADKAAADKAAADKAAAEAKVNPVTITVWTTFAATYDQMFIDASKAYTALNPHVTFKYEKFTGTQRDQKVALAKSSNTLPTMILTNGNVMADGVHQGYIAPVTDVVEASKDSLLTQEGINTMLIAKNYYMVPLFDNVYTLIYNADMFKAAGLGQFLPANKDAYAEWKLDDFENQILPSLKKYFKGNGGYPVGLSFGDSQGDTNVLHWLRMYGGSLHSNETSVANDKVIQAMDRLYQWNKLGYVNADATTKKYVDLRADFQNQKAGMFSTQNQSIVAFKLEMAKGTIKTFDVRMATVPKNVDGKDSQTVAVYHNGAMIFNNGKPDEIKAGKEFLSWYLKQDKYMSEFSKLSGRPATKSAYNVVAPLNPDLRETATVEKYAYDQTGNVPGYNDTRDLFAKMMQSVYSDKQNSRQAATDYTIAANKVISEYKARSLVLNK